MATILSGKVAVVTGAGGAIGAAIVAMLVRQGADVAALDIDAKAIAGVAKFSGGTVIPVQVDLGDAERITEAVATIHEQLGAPAILVNNAGILSNNKIAATDLSEWRRVQAVNVEAALLLTAATLPSMRAARWGRIVNMASFAAKSGGLTAGTAYSVSKAAMIGLTFATARETAGDGITVNAIAPAYVMSPMVSEQLTQEQRAAQLAQIPVGRFCEPEEVAHAVEFLCSQLAGFITGEVIDMNGGLHFD